MSARTVGPWILAHTSGGVFIKSGSTPGYVVQVHHVRGGQDPLIDAEWIARTLNDAERDAPPEPAQYPPLAQRAQTEEAT